MRAIYLKHGAFARPQIGSMIVRASPETGLSAADPLPDRIKPEVIYRHTVLVRITHWINALVIFVMIGTGMNIFNAHPRLYWGTKGSDADPTVAPWLSMLPVNTPHGVRGFTQVGPLKLDTTGLFGWSNTHGHPTFRGFPEWLTIPTYTDLADGRHWHFLFAWLLVFNGALYLAWSLWIRHIQRDILPTGADLKAIPRSVWDHVRLRHPTGEEAKRYNVLQRLAYLGFILLAVTMVLSGLCLSPGFNAVLTPLLDLMGGRQSARSIHFICMSLIVLFILVHVAEVFIAGPLNEIGSMITGRYRVPPPHAADASAVEAAS